jgi:acyl carrier protein
MLNDQPNDLMSAISEVFAPAEVSPESTLESLGATSVTLLRLMSSLQRRFGIVLDVVDMFSVDDVGDLIRLVEERMAEKGFAPT